MTLTCHTAGLSTHDYNIFTTLASSHELQIIPVKTHRVHYTKYLVSLCDQFIPDLLSLFLSLSLRLDRVSLLQAKTTNLCEHLRRSGVPVRQSLFFPRVFFLSADCQLDEELEKKKELLCHKKIDDFLRSFREGYMAWISDALTPSWISGVCHCHLCRPHQHSMGLIYACFFFCIFMQHHKLMQ